MTIAYGFRPRSDRERLRMAELFREAPPVVAIGYPDDGWAAACLRVSGRTPVWANDGDPSDCEAVLARLGLPGLGDGPADALLDGELKLHPIGDLPPRPRLVPVHDAATGPLVTVLVCTYNRAKFLPEALRSALAQTWPCEVVVVDDGSTDETPDVLAGFPDVRAFRQPRNAGKPAALARGLAEAKGEAVLVLDDDDLLLPGAVQVLATALFANPGLSAVWADTIVFDGDSGAVTQVRPATRLPGHLALRVAVQQIPAMPGATLVRTSAWRALGPLDAGLVRGQDMDLFLALAQRAPIECVPLPVFRYRSHDGLRGSAAGQWKKQDRAEHDARFRAFVAPVFLRRYTAASPVADRADGHAWALGLFQRGLVQEARAELARWPGPWSPSEVFARRTCGLPAVEAHPSSTLYVVDDGDEGALEATLAARGADHALVVGLEVPREPLGNVLLYWGGTYVARGAARVAATRPGPWHLALSSAPGWNPPPIDDIGLLPELPGPEALLCLAALLGWEGPVRTRIGVREIHGPNSILAWKARGLLDAGDPTRAMAPLGVLLQRLPTWRGAWRMAAEAFTALGHANEARACRVRSAA